MVWLSGTLRLRCAALSVKINQISPELSGQVTLITLRLRYATLSVKSISPSTGSGLILKATNSVSVSSVSVVHAGFAAAEVEVVRVGTTNRTAPIVAAGTDIDEKTAGIADARHGQFKRGGKSTCSVVATPAQHFCV